MKDRIYLCVDLKSFYASVECIDRNLDPFNINLVVADESRTQKTICLAASPALKSYGVPSRARLFEVNQIIDKVNNQRKIQSGIRHFENESFDKTLLDSHPEYKVTFMVAPPRMAHYIKWSTKVYEVYLKYISKEDIHVYSIDEVFMDITDYLGPKKMTARQFATEIIKDINDTTGLGATGGIGSNMYLAKVALDIEAKNIAPDENGVRIAELDVDSYRRTLWSHRPLTDFWRVGRGYYAKLERLGLYTMGDIARYSLSPYGEERLYKLFGVNAELLIDHAWGIEPCTMKDIKSYQPKNTSLGSGQVLHCPYDFPKARIVFKEMLEMLSLDLVEKKLVSDQFIFTVGYDIQSLTDSSSSYKGEIVTDYYGRKVPKHAHATVNLPGFTSSFRVISKEALKAFDNTVDNDLLIRRINISFNHIMPEDSVEEEGKFDQLDFFSDYNEIKQKRQQETKELKKERKIQEATIDIKKRFGKNALIKGVNLVEGATAIDRNNQIGGHKK